MLVALCASSAASGPVVADGGAMPKGLLLSLHANARRRPGAIIPGKDGMLTRGIVGHLLVLHYPLDHGHVTMWLVA